MCVDFTDLNKACPKDDYPLPKIDRLVDSTAGHGLFSFMDANAGYHQIPMSEKDQAHTAFITSQGVYCYKVMPFGLKNAGATYQRLVNKIFGEQIGRNIEVYVDDMIVKSKLPEGHPSDLEETLKTLRLHSMKLNPKKCVFGVKGGKCLGFLVDERGIEANPDKIQALLDMKSPRSVKEVQRLTGCIAALDRFLSRSADKSLPFFKVLKGAGFSWNAEAEAAFQQLKAHLSTIPKLVSPLAGETLYLYLGITEYALSAVLVAEREKQQHPVYFISHAFRGAEAKYPLIEKLVYALVMASRKLKPYFQAHPIKVLTSQPLRKVIESRNHSNRMTEWANQLSDFGLEYEPRRAIKAQALADFIVECTNRPPERETTSQKSWELYVDGSATRTGCGAGILIKTPSGDRLEYAVKFSFLASNNESEYEALILGIQMCQAAGAVSVQAKSDSQLIVGQIQGDFEAKEDSMKMYLSKARKVIDQLQGFTIQHIPRSENQQADALSRLASSAEGMEPRTIIWEVLPEPNINVEAFMSLDRGPDWMEKIIKYKRDNVLPDSEKEAASIKKQADWFLWHNEALYKVSYTHPLLKCVTPEEGNYILREIHQGACGSHQGARTIAGKALRSGFYWPTLRSDATDLVKRCGRCQEFANLTRMPANDLTTVQAVLPFDRWGMDILGPFPVASGQRKFLIVAVDYFTKWIEAEPLAKISDNLTARPPRDTVIASAYRLGSRRFHGPKAMVRQNLLTRLS
ncbi:uncharacterized protein [Spinacia oleracea]|uniref:Uncharacterized protein n=1 Tax=Spinacia oleracea TaxID=3562 RepID=A0ABM3RSE4_SPIOL|nr:uncharacterized protein LOC130472111 [Spinacia oleracea]